MNHFQKLNYHFYLLKYRKNKEGKMPIYLRINVDNKVSNVSTNKFILIDEWNSKGSVKTSNKVVQKHLNTIERKLLNIYNSRLKTDRLITSIILKNELLGKEEINKHSIISSIQYHNENMKAQLGVKFAKGTLKNYKTTLKYIKEFILLIYKVEDIPLNKLNFEFINDYELFLTTQKNCTNNGVMKQVQRLKKVINLAIANEWLFKDPFIKFKIHYDRTDRGYLTLKEVDLIINVELDNKLSNVRDYFIFSCYTGLSYVDIKKLCLGDIQEDDDGNLWIIQSREKSNVKSMIPLLPKAIELFDKYKKSNNKSIFKVLSNQKTNKYLKEIAKEVSINKRITFHIARHTFATTITLSKGVPIETVSKMLGHNKISTTQIYSRVLKEKILNDMNNIKNKSR